VKQKAQYDRKGHTKTMVKRYTNVRDKGAPKFGRGRLVLLWL